MTLLTFNTGCSPANEPAVNSSPIPEVSVSPKEETPTLTPNVTQVILAEVSRQTQIPSDRLSISDAIAKTWPDGCLGLAKPDELCSQALVPGWQVTVSDGSQTWVYRSDRTGQNIRRSEQ